MRSWFIAAAAAMLLPGTANAAAFVNGSFESGTVSDPFSTLPAGSSALSGWTITGNGIDYISTLWTASNGSRSLDLSASAAGGISQLFDTLAGRSYRVTYDLAGNPDNGADTKSISVFATGAGNLTDTQLFDTTGKSRSAMGWSSRSYVFKADSASTTLSFSSNNTSAFGPALDNVSVNLLAVPEPSTWAMMIGGVGLVGGAVRRRRVRSAALA